MKANVIRFFVCVVLILALGWLVGVYITWDWDWFSPSTWSKVGRAVSAASLVPVAIGAIVSVNLAFEPWDWD